MLAAENTSELQQYSYVDGSATVSRQYYRLRTVHADGKADYSGIIVLNNDMKTEISLYSNPATEFVNVRTSDSTGIAKLQVFNSAGQTTNRSANVPVIGNQIQVQVGELPTSIYFLQLQNEEQMNVLKFEKK